MFSIIRMAARWLAALSRPQGETAEPEQMSLHDWADLPVYHPVCDRSPC